MLKKIFNLFEGKHYRYIIVGFFVFFINLLVAEQIFKIDYFLGNQLKRNLGNLITIEIALLISYPLHKWVTWLEGWDNFFPKLLYFHSISLLGIIIRILIFAILDSLGLHYLLSIIISILVVILINFVGFDRYVFRDEFDRVIENEKSYSVRGTGSQVIETIEEATNYNFWIAEKIIDYVGSKNLEIGAGQGTIASFIIRDFPLHVSDLSEVNYESLNKRFVNDKNFIGISSDIMFLEDWSSFDCIYSSNVLEHVPDDISIIDHSLKLLKKGGFFVAIVPAMPILYSDFDKKIGHYRRYSLKDKNRILNTLKKNWNLKCVEFRYFNPIGVFGWFFKMKLLGQQDIKKNDVMIMNSLIPFIAWTDSLPLPFGQSLLFVLKKI